MAQLTTGATDACGLEVARRPSATSLSAYERMTSPAWTSPSMEVQPAQARGGLCDLHPPRVTDWAKGTRPESCSRPARSPLLRGGMLRLRERRSCITLREDSMNAWRLVDHYARAAE